MADPDRLPPDLENLGLEIDYALPAEGEAGDPQKAVAEVLASHFWDVNNHSTARRLVESFGIDTTGMSPEQVTAALRDHPARAMEILGANAMIGSRGLDRPLLADNATLGDVLDVYQEIHDKESQEKADEPKQ